MRTMAGALQDGVADDPDRKETAVSSLVSASERLLRLVQDLMQLAKLDLNELPLDIRHVDLRELVNTAVASFEAEAAAAGIVLHQPGPGQPIMVMADPDRITQVLDNVIGNAISHAGAGAAVTVRMEDGDPIRVIFCDTGKGIPAEDLPRIFDSFYRADAARTPGEYHSGLGLSISRRLIEAHGGELTVSSEEGKGTSVVMTIPRAVARMKPSA
jgi:signal transduction histidine kinase